MRHARATRIALVVTIWVVSVGVLGLGLWFLFSPGADREPAGQDDPQVRTHVARNDPQEVAAAGPVDAPVEMVVFSDYQCPYCAQLSHDVVPMLLEYAEAGDLRVEWYDLSVYGEDSRTGAKAALAAGDQGAFWEYHQRLLAEGQPATSRELQQQALEELAAELDLDVEKFSADMSSGEVSGRIGARENLARRLGVSSTPTILLDGERIVGAAPREDIEERIETALEKSRQEEQ